MDGREMTNRVVGTPIKVDTRKAINGRKELPVAYFMEKQLGYGKTKVRHASWGDVEFTLAGMTKGFDGDIACLLEHDGRILIAKVNECSVAI